MEYDAPSPKVQTCGLVCGYGSLLCSRWISRQNSMGKWFPPLCCRSYIVETEDINDCIINILSIIPFTLYSIINVSHISPMLMSLFHSVSIKKYRPMAPSTVPPLSGNRTNQQSGIHSSRWEPWMNCICPLVRSKCAQHGAIRRLCCVRGGRGGYLCCRNASTVKNVHSTRTMCSITSTGM